MTIEEPERGHSRTVLAQDKPCVVHDMHIPKPVITQLHHIFPIYLQQRIWKDASREHPHDGELVAICGTGHDSVHALIDRLLTGHGVDVYPKGFSPQEVALAREGCHRYRQAGGII